MTNPSILSRAGRLLALLVLTGPVMGQEPPLEPLAVSPSDEWALGFQAPELECSFLGAVQWRVQPDLSPKAAAVTDTGRAVVVGLRREPRVGESPSFDEYLVVLIYDETGRVRQRQELRRTPVDMCVLGGDPRYPWIRGVMVDEASDLAVVSLKTGAGPGEWWWCYKLSTGALVNGLYPRDEVTDHPRWFNLMDARIIPGTGQFATLWSTGTCYERERWRGRRPGDTLVVIGRWGGTLAYQSLAGVLEDPCAWLQAVGPGQIELRCSGRDLPLVIEVEDTEKGQVELRAR